MYKYTFADIIMDPTDPRLKDAIGKECYFADCPKGVLNLANNTSDTFRLRGIDMDGEYPFIDDEQGLEWAVIIIMKEEPKPKYVPFESKEEFIDAFHYHDNANYSETEDILLNYGMWLRCKENGGLFQVVGFLNDAVYLNLRAFDTNYQGMLNDFEFLDGSPCGKEVESEEA